MRLVRKVRKYVYATPEMVEIFDFFTISRMLEKLTQSKIVCFSAKDSKSQACLHRLPPVAKGLLMALSEATA